MGEGLFAGRDGKLSKPGHTLGIFAIDVVMGVEVLHFSGNATGVVCWVKEGDWPDADFGGEQSLPIVVHSFPDGCDSTESCDNNTFALG